MANVRIKDQTTDTDLQTGDYVIVDSDSEGTRKYDLGALVARVAALEAGGRGVSDDLAAALLQIAEKVAYIDANGDDYYQDLYDALDSGEKAVTYSLTHVTSSNTAATVESGSSYSTTLTADSGYSINSVVITMGGVDVTSSVYSNGTVSITNVTGNIVITASAAQTPTSITATYTQSGTVYTTTPLDDLKSDLVVTANYSGGGSDTVPSTDYTLSGTLTVGTSTVTVTYMGLTTTFNVTVSEVTPLYQLPEMGPTTSTTMTGTLEDVDEITAVMTGTSSGKSISFNNDGTITGTPNASTWFSLSQGDSWTMEVADISYTGNENSANKFNVTLKNNSGTEVIKSGDIAVTQTGDGTMADVTATGTVASNTGNLTLSIYVHRKITLNFKVRFYVNGVRYV